MVKKLYSIHIRAFRVRHDTTGHMFISKKYQRMVLRGKATIHHVFSVSWISMAETQKQLFNVLANRYFGQMLNQISFQESGLITLTIFRLSVYQFRHWFTLYVYFQIHLLIAMNPSLFYCLREIGVGTLEEKSTMNV